VDLYKRAQHMDLPGDLGTAEIPAVLHSVWKSPDGTTGHILVNWTGTDQEAALALLGPDGQAFIVDPSGRAAVPEAQVRAGSVSLTVPARGVRLVEQQ
jgi:hypothetical protein